MTKEVKDMTMKELKQELKGIQDHIDNYAFGKFELNYKNELLIEMKKRQIK